MKLNFKIIIPIIAAVIISWVGNIYFFNRYSIERPVLLNSYLAYPLEEKTSFELKYITNIYDKDNFYQASFPEINTQPFCVNVSSYKTINNSNYMINKVKLDLNTVFLDNGKRLIDSADHDEISLKKIKLFTGSRKSYEYELGEIRLYKNTLSKDSPLELVSGMTSNNNLGIDTFKAKTDIKITEVKSPMLYLIPEMCDVQIDGTPLSSISNPLSLKSGEQIEVKYQFKDNKPLKLFFPVILKGTDIYGKAFAVSSCIHFEMDDNITAWDVKKIIDESR